MPRAYVVCHKNNFCLAQKGIRNSCEIRHVYILLLTILNDKAIHPCHSSGTLCLSYYSIKPVILSRSSFVELTNLSRVFTSENREQADDEDVQRFNSGIKCGKYREADC